MSDGGNCIYNVLILVEEVRFLSRRNLEFVPRHPDHAASLHQVAAAKNLQVRIVPYEDPNLMYETSNAQGDKTVWIVAYGRHFEWILQ